MPALCRLSARARDREGDLARTRLEAAGQCIAGDRGGEADAVQGGTGRGGEDVSVRGAAAELLAFVVGDDVRVVELERKVVGRRPRAGNLDDAHRSEEHTSE